MCNTRERLSRREGLMSRSWVCITSSSRRLSYATHDREAAGVADAMIKAHQATHGGFRPKCAGGFEAQIDHPSHGTLALARTDGELARLQHHIPHAMVGRVPPACG